MNRIFAAGKFKTILSSKGRYGERKHITVTLSGGETGSANVTTNGVPAGDYSVSILNNGPKEVTVAMSYSVTIT